MANPLDDKHLDAIKESLRLAKDTQETITKAKQAGFPVAEQEERLTEAVNRLNATRAAFFPGR